MKFLIPEGTLLLIKYRELFTNQLKTATVRSISHYVVDSENEQFLSVLVGNITIQITYAKPHYYRSHEVLNFHVSKERIMRYES